MSPYKLIKGSDKNIAAFEEQVANAMLDGYDIANDLVVQLRPPSATGETEALLFQAMICEEVLEFDEDDDEEDEDEEVDEFEEEAQLS
jgi:hypothetical protein